MTPPVRYATTRDGVRIAYASEGDGPICVHMPLVPWTNISMMFEVEARLGRSREMAHNVGREIVRYDVRGAGLSEGDTLDLGLDAQLLDLAAVVEHVTTDHVALLAPVHSGPAAIAYAAQHPERVSHLILWCAYARGVDFFGEQRVLALRDTLSISWQLFTEHLALELIGWDEGGAAQSVATLIRQSIGLETAAEALETLSALDVTSMLPAVHVPTLVFRRRKPTADPLARIARRVAARIPSARLVYMDELALAPEFVVGSRATWPVIDEFLSEPPGNAPAPARHTGMATLERAVDAQLAGERPATAAVSSTDMVTPREVEVLRLLANGDTNVGIARTLQLSVRTVERHLSNIYRKLDVRGRAEAVAVALRSGIA